MLRVAVPPPQFAENTSFNDSIARIISRSLWNIEIKGGKEEVEEEDLIAAGSLRKAIVLKEDSRVSLNFFAFSIEENRDHEYIYILFHRMERQIR